MNYLNMKSRYYVLLRVIVAVTCLLSHSMLFAQEGRDKLRAELDYMFQHIDKSKVPTGLLLDYAIEYEDLDLFDGNISRNPNQKVDNAIFSGILQTLKSASVTSGSMTDIKGDIEKLKKTVGEEDVLCSIVLFDYSRIKASALRDGLIEYKNGQVYDAWTEECPYSIYSVFAGCCFRRTIWTGRVNFVLPKDLIVSNVDIKSIEINYGAGYVSLAPSSKLSATLRTGKNLISFRVTRTNGSILYSSAEIEVINNSDNLGRSAGLLDNIVPDDTITIQGTPYRGVSTKSTVFVKYAYNRNKITRPFIFVEGFNPKILSKYGMGDWSFDMPLIQIVAKILSGYGYDFVYVDWEASESYIQANANNLIDILDKINELEDGNEPIIMMGHSMGGLVARYALCQMEKEKKTHNVGTYISYDVPHLGAHIPLGLLYGFYALSKFIKEYDLISAMISNSGEVGIKDLISMGECMAHSTSAQQMLMFYVDAVGSFNNSEHRLWQTELNNLGFPKGDDGKTINLLAISNSNYDVYDLPDKYIKIDFAAWTELSNPLLSVGMQIAFHDIVASLLSALPGRSSISGHFNLFPATSTGDVVADIKMKYKNKFLWLIDISKTLFEYKRSYPNIPLYDGFQSSYYGLNMSSMNDREGNGIPIVGGYNFDSRIERFFPFIPVSSALACGDGISNIENDFTAYDSQKSLFGENYYIKPTPSQQLERYDFSERSHAIFTQGAIEWIISRLNRTISGPSIAQDGVKYELYNTFGPIEWSTSNPNIAVIDQNGVITVKGEGIININAVNGNYKYSKSVIVGMPRFILSASHEPGGYKISATCIDAHFKNRLSDFNDAIRYVWGVKYTNREIEWLNTESSDIIVPLESGSNKILVYFKTLDMLGNESVIQSIEVNSSEIYNSTMTSLFVTNSDKLHLSKYVYMYYDNGKIYFNYASGIDDKYRTRDWAIYGGYIISPLSPARRIDSDNMGFRICDILPSDEFEFIKKCSEEEDKQIYLLLLLNHYGEQMQYIPITFTYKSVI